MTWRNPWAWFGLAALALPVVIHLLGRRPPKPVRFPTLRFLDVTREVPARRHRLNDVPLLAVRLGVIAAVVAALAQPWISAAPRPAMSRDLARAIVVDTSASMSRPAPNGRTAIDNARDLAQTALADASVPRVFEATALASGVTAAAAWLAEQPARRELVLISDFQRGSLQAADLAMVPGDVGVRFTATDIRQDARTRSSSNVWGGLAWRTDVNATAASTDATWTALAGAPGLPPFLKVHVAPGDENAVARAIAAARLEGVPAAAEGQAVTLVFPGAADRAALIARTRAIHRPWMFDVIDGIANDSTAAALAREISSAAGDPPAAAPLTVVLEDGSGRARVRAGADAEPSTGLLLFVDAAPGDAFAAAVIARAWREAARAAEPLAEAEPNRIDDATLRSWERDAAANPSPPADGSGRSDGRWFWLVALVLLGVEGWMRRAAQAASASPTEEAPHARVA